MSSRTRAIAHVATALVVSLAIRAQGLGAQVTSMSAIGTYSLNGGGTVTLTSLYPTNNPVDILGFPSGPGGSAGLHTYGDVSGSFGSRSSGSGVYDATGNFTISEQITNTGTSVASAVFNFYITPGNLSNSGSATLTGGQSIFAGIIFDVQRDASSVWGSSATLQSTGGGAPVFAYTGTNLYTLAGPGSYFVGGTNQSVNLGLLNPGQSLTLTYTLSTHAWGTASNPCVGGPGGGGGGANGLFTGLETLCAGSHASSGDPFSVDFDNELPLEGGLTLVTPEPSTALFMLAGLGFLAGIVRRRRGSE